MNIEERIKYAEQKRDEALSDGTLQALTYWNGYLAALRKLRRRQTMKDKQIDEMAKIMNECCNVYDDQGRHIRNKCGECEEWSDDNHCCCSYNQKQAEALYTAGYRKASDVAREIFEEIDREICLALESNYKARDHRQMIVIAHGSSTIDREFIEYVSGKIDALRGINDFIAELKNKCTEEGNEKLY